MRYNDTMVGAATATGRTDNGGSSTGPHINSAASIAARLHAAAVVQLQAAHAGTRATTATTAVTAAKLADIIKQAHATEVDFLRAQITVLEVRVARRTR